MTESEVGAEQQEESERRRSGVEELAAFFVGGDGGARLRLMDFGHGVADGGRSGGNALQPVDEATETLGVSGAGVLGEVLPPIRQRRVAGVRR